MDTNQNISVKMVGLIYLGVIITGIFSLIYVPDKLINYNSALLTFQNISASETLFRLGIASGLLCYGFFLLLSIFLYRLLQKVNENMAKLMVLFVIISVAMYFLNASNEIMVLSLLKSPNYTTKVYSATLLQAQVLSYLHQYSAGMRLIHIFSGLWLFPLGYLILKSNFLPKYLGILLILGCFGYIINFFGFILMPSYTELGISSYLGLPASIGEIGTCLWLLIMGTKRKSTSILTT
ncbi:DUF4386 domain-containing protein [Pedobacter sp. SD-b]|uniref:DUF4386 domain-containing protein n=1 Tax=Pedobacter segetis TaxID=2793069 RepID=A0ABS1BJT1_9SPHI|nr:DUF4386 domain-containing protein [Pedobacter segetis]MBK0383143.1 DUF4386 domain-containing protein [Pedobacter segetis]